MEAVRVSVVIPCYNAADFLPDTLASAYAQTLRSLEVIVVDDGSTDDSAQVARACAASALEIPTRVLQIPNSGGPSTPRNVGVDAARADLVVCIDADDQFTPSFLERCVTTLDGRPDVSIAYTDQQDFDASDRLHSVPEYDFRTITRRNIFGNCSVFRKQAWRDAGGFDPDMLYEDWFFWLMCGVRGHLGVKVHGVDWRYRVRDQGLYRTEYLPKDRLTKAQMIQRLPGLYDAQQRAWAELVLADDPRVDGIPHDVGVIPDFAPPPPPAPIVADLNLAAAPSSDPDHPLVSVVVTDAEPSPGREAAIRTVHAQLGLGGEVEVIVVDSDTPAALELALAAAGGEFIALVSSRDRWPADRLATHVAALRAHPRAGLVHGDQTVTDASGEVHGPSFFATLSAAPPEGRGLGRLLTENFVARGAMTFRAGLLVACSPFPDGVTDPPWWIAAAIASVAEVRSVTGVATRTRADEPDGPPTTVSPSTLSPAQAEVAMRRTLLRELAADWTVTPAELLAARAALLEAIRRAAAGEPGGPRAVLEPSVAMDATVATELPRLAVGAPRSRALVRALAVDPFDGALGLELDHTLPREHLLGPLSTPDPVIDLLPMAPLTLGWFDELTSHPELLDGLGTAPDAGDHRELVVLAPQTADIAPLIRRLARAGVAPDATIDVRVVSEPTTRPAAALLASLTQSCLTRMERPEPYASLPRHPAAADT